ncbi:MAG: membrane dipeptidase [Pseudomonadota bacterium]
MNTIKRFGAASVLSLFLMSPAISVAAVSAADKAVYQLAQQCYSVRSPGTGKYLTNNNGVFSFSTTNAGSAERFYMKPARLGDFLLTDRSGRYLSSAVPQVESPLSKPSLGAEWDVSAKGVGNGHYRFHFKNRLTQSPIQKEYVKKIKHSFWWFTWYTYEPRIDRHFDLVARNDCRDYPEITANVRGTREDHINSLKGNVNEPVRGYVDAHTHITSYEFMGGKVMHGDPFHKYGVPYALEDSRSSHGPNGSLDLIGNIFVFGDPTYQYDTSGWPHFNWWPNPTQLTHSGYYYKWMERAWLSGLRMTVTQLVENEVLCNVQRSVNPAGWTGTNSCNTMDSIRLQAKRLRQMEDYIDAQYGGPGKGFFRIVTSPEQARQVIADGKLAVVLGVEASETLNCGEGDFCSTAKVEQGLTELYNLGVRSIFPAHKFDNKLSGAVIEDGFINIGEALATGHYYETKHCDDKTRGKAMTSGFPVIGDIPVIGGLLGQIGATPTYDDHNNHCNVRGLTPLGVYLVNRMIDLNMIVDLDHLSADAASQVMDIVEARDYSGAVSSHSFMHSAKGGGVHDNFRRMLKVGGFAAPYNSNTDGIDSRVLDYLDVAEQTPYLNAVGIGTDMSGLGGQPKPRGSANSDPLDYPFTNEFGLTFDEQVSGHRTFNLNRDGMAHYGMLADQVQDFRKRADNRVYEAIMNSAEGYLQMWERAEGHLDKQHVNPL